MGPKKNPTQAKASGQADLEPGWDVFLSHSSQNNNLALQLEHTLQSNNISVWLDRSDLRRRGLLLSALQEALLQCGHLVLLWSQAAEKSRYVTAEWNFAWNREIEIVPCCLDETLLPLGLAGYLYCDFRTDFNTGYSQLQDALSKTKKPEPEIKHRRTFKPATTPKYQENAGEIFRGQDALLKALDRGQVDTAAKLQFDLDLLLRAAVKEYPQDAYMLGAAGYQKKNDYLIKYWPQIQNRQSPQDPLLTEAEKYFWEALQVQPDFPAALNGLGNILWLRGDLDAAEFYVQRSLELANSEGNSYAYAEEDLKNIRLEKRRREVRDKRSGD